MQELEISSSFFLLHWMIIWKTLSVVPYFQNTLLHNSSLALLVATALIRTYLLSLSLRVCINSFAIVKFTLLQKFLQNDTALIRGTYLLIHSSAQTFSIHCAAQSLNQTQPGVSPTHCWVSSLYIVLISHCCKSFCKNYTLHQPWTVLFATIHCIVVLFTAYSMLCKTLQCTGWIKMQMQMQMLSFLPKWSLAGAS